jgi:hypothetical protein
MATMSKELVSSLRTAEKCGYREYAFELGLTLGQLESQSGATRNGRARVQAIAQQAQAQGFGLIARNAEEILKAP